MIHKGQEVYYGRVINGWYDIYDCKVLNVNEERKYFTVITKEKQTWLFNFEDLERIVFINRSDALDYVRRREGEDKL